MEKKKNKNVDEHKRSTLYLMIGLVASASISLMAFEWKSHNLPEPGCLGTANLNIDDWTEVPPTIINPPQPPPIQMPKLIEIPNDEEVLDIPEFIIDIETTEDDIIMDPPELPDEEADDPFIPLEKEAAFPGGREGWAKFLNRHFRYPRMAKKMGIEGRVIMAFDVSATGEISNIEILRSVGGGCDEEAIRVLTKSPKWEPGEQRGRPVKSKHQMSILFRLK